jgi:hypothetical protein
MLPPPQLLRFKVFWPISSTDVYISAPTATGNFRHVSIMLLMLSTNSNLVTGHRSEQQSVEANERERSEDYDNNTVTTNNLDHTEADGETEAEGGCTKAGGKRPEANGEPVEVDEKPNRGSGASTPVNETADSQLPSHSTKDNTPSHKK